MKKIKFKNLKKGDVFLQSDEIFEFEGFTDGGPGFYGIVVATAMMLKSLDNERKDIKYHSIWLGKDFGDIVELIDKESVNLILLGT